MRLIIGGFLIIPFFASSQSLDSLLQELANSSNYADKIALHEEIANTCFRNGDYSNSLEHWYDIIRLKERSADSSNLAKYWFNVGRNHYFMRSLKNSNAQALQFLGKAYQLGIILQDSIAIYKSTRGIAAILGETKKFDSAFYYLSVSRETANKLGDFSAVSGLYVIEGSFHLEKDNDVKQAERAYQKSMDFAKKSGDEEALAYSIRSLGSIHIMKGEYDEAEQSFLSAYDIEKRLGSKDGIINALSGLIWVYENGDDVAALAKVSREIQSYKDSLYNENTIRAMTEVETKYATEKKEQAIQLLQAETALKDEIIEGNRLFLIFLGSVTLLTAGFLWLYFRKQKYKFQAQLSIEKSQTQIARFKAVIEAEENERKRIAQDLHDGLGQLLSTVRLSVSALDENEKIRSVQSSIHLIDSAVGEVRTISHNLMPRALSQIGLIAAIRQQVRSINESNQLEVELTAMDDLQVDSTVAVAVFRIIQELMNNAIKYASPSKIGVSISLNSGLLLVEIYDDGVGFDTQNIRKSKGIGWQNIYSRVDILKGEIDISSKLGAGTTVRISIPYDQSNQPSSS